jgi:hypothetical protein
MEGASRMRVRSALRRLAVTLPFFGTAAVVLTLFGNPPLPPGDESALILIVTNSTLNPAFAELEDWNRAQGCRSELLTLDAGPPNERRFVEELGALCRERGVTGLILGGNRRQLPLMSGSGRGQFPGPDENGIARLVPIPTPRRSPIPSDLAMGRVPVGTLDEAWAFVEACRQSGETLDQLFGRTGDMAAVLPAGEEVRLVDLSAPQP